MGIEYIICNFFVQKKWIIWVLKAAVNMFQYDNAIVEDKVKRLASHNITFHIWTVCLDPVWAIKIFTNIICLNKENK